MVEQIDSEGISRRAILAARRRAILYTVQSGGVHPPEPHLRAGRYCIEFDNRERWLSGLKRGFAKPVTGKLVRRFESCPLRWLLPVSRNSRGHGQLRFLQAHFVRFAGLPRTARGAWRFGLAPPNGWDYDRLASQRRPRLIIPPFRFSPEALAARLPADLISSST